MTRYFNRLAASWVTLMCLGTSVLAQTWPTKPIKIQIAFGPGSASVIFARMIGEPLSRAVGQRVIVESKPGAAGQIAAEFVARAPADGYTLFLTTNTKHSANPYLFKKLSYDPIKDFTPISRILYFPFLLVVDGELPINNIAELLTYAKANPQQIGYSYSSSAGQVPAAALSNATKMGAVGVAYKSAPEALNSVVGGQVTFSIIDFATSQALIKAGRLRALAVTPQTRTTLAPNLPTISEAVGIKDFGVTAWLGLFGPANLPVAIVDKLNTEIQKILGSHELQEKLRSMGVEPTPAGPEEFQQFVKSQLGVWQQQIKISGMEPQ